VWGSTIDSAILKHPLNCQSSNCASISRFSMVSTTYAGISAREDFYKFLMGIPINTIVRVLYWVLRSTVSYCLQTLYFLILCKCCYHEVSWCSSRGRYGGEVHSNQFSLPWHCLNFSSHLSTRVRSISSLRITCLSMGQQMPSCATTEGSLWLHQAYSSAPYLEAYET